MSIGQLPPQAYTRDMLASAYEWLKTQPTGVKELALDADSLVALFLQSKRRRATSLEFPNGPNQPQQEQSTAEMAGPPKATEPGQHDQIKPPPSFMSTQADKKRPISSDSFKSDLQSLAKDLKQFDPGGITNAKFTTHFSGVANSPSPSAATINNAAVGATPPTPQMPAKQTANSPSTITGTQNQQNIDPHIGHLPEDLLKIVYSVQTKLHLSTPAEAVKMLISLGFDKIREILPK
jgi:hypothetical protein